MKFDQPAVGCSELPTHVGEGKVSLLLGHLSIESIDTAVRDVPRWPASLDDQR